MNEHLRPDGYDSHAVSWVSYTLHLVSAVGAVLPGGQFVTVLLLAAWLIDWIKKGDVSGWEATHYRHRIRSVCWAALLYVLTLPLWMALVFPGWLAWMAISVWFLYRIVLGMLRLNAGRPVGTDGDPADALSHPHLPR